MYFLLSNRRRKREKLEFFATWLELSLPSCRQGQSTEQRTAQTLPHPITASPSLPTTPVNHKTSCTHSLSYIPSSPYPATLNPSQPTLPPLSPLNRPKPPKTRLSHTPRRNEDHNERYQSPFSPVVLPRTLIVRVPHSLRLKKKDALILTRKRTSNRSYPRCPLRLQRLPTMAVDSNRVVICSRRVREGIRFVESVAFRCGGVRDRTPARRSRRREGHQADSKGRLSTGHARSLCDSDGFTRPFGSHKVLPHLPQLVYDGRCGRQPRFPSLQSVEPYHRSQRSLENRDDDDDNNLFDDSRNLKGNLSTLHGRSSD